MSAPAPAAARVKAAAQRDPGSAPSAETAAAGPGGEHALALALHPPAPRPPASPPVPPPPAAKTLRRRAAGGRMDDAFGGPAGVRPPGGEGGGGVEDTVRGVLESGAGRPLDPGTRAFFEAGFGRGLGGVRVHTGAAADASARAVHALAYTVGRDVVFRDGRYAPDSGEGKRLLAHELAHVVQQDGAAPHPARAADGPLAVGAADAPAEREADQAADRVLRGEAADPGREPGGPVIRRAPGDPPAPAPAPAPVPAPAATGLTDADRDLLADEGVVLTAGDEQWLGENYPHGFLLEQGEVQLLSTFSDRAVGSRHRVVQVVEPPPLLPGVQTWIFHVGKARSILISSRGSGASVLLDAGVDLRAPAGAAERLVAALGHVTGTGGAATPNLLIGSHTDGDHLKAASTLLADPAFSRTAVQIASEQMRSAISATEWTRFNINLNPTQQLIEIRVAGTGGQVHIHKTFIDNLQLVEFRSVAAHTDLATPGRGRYNKNRTSAVTVGIDMVTGERMVYNADAEGGQFTEIINSVGERAFRRILGAEGRNLRLFEYPHHGGMVSGAGDVTGMLRMLQLSFEASDGSIRFFTQTKTSFAAGPSASIRFLDVAGVDVERVMADPAPPGQSTVTRVTGSQVEQLTLDTSGIRSAVTVAQARETEIMSAYRALHQIRQLAEQVSVMERSLSMSTAPAELLASIGQTRTDLAAAETGVRGAVGRVWAEMAAASGTGSRAGLRAGNATAQLTVEINALGTHLRTVDVQRQVDNLAAHEAKLTAYGRVFSTMFGMFDAMRTQRWPELERLRSEYQARLQAADAIMGVAGVDEHVRGAWAAVRAHWTPERLRTIGARLGNVQRAQRIMMSHYRIILLESLGRQMQLNELAERVAHGGRQVYGAGGTAVTPVRTRVAAGFMAVLELARLGLEVAAAIDEAGDAQEAAETHHRAEGTRNVYWWLRLGAHPTLALVKRNWWSGYDTVSDGMSQEDVWAAATGARTEGVPAFEMVVVEEVSGDDLRQVAYSLYLEMHTLEDWHAFNDSSPVAPVFKRFDEGWAVRFWDREESRYVYHARSALDQPLDTLHRSLEEGQTDLLRERAAAAGAEGQKTIADTAWVGNDRYAYVYNPRGNLERIDFGAHVPRFSKVNEQYNWQLREQMALVQAVDMPTWRELSQHYWREEGAEYLDQHGGGRYYSVFRNRRGLALVEADDLEAAPAE